MTIVEPATAPRAGALPTEPKSWAEFPAFMEVQFPVSKVSKEAYKERKSGPSQTLTGLGKWWGRKPLVVVRAAVLGLLLPATDDARADRETFLALMTMDDDGMVRRLEGKLPASRVYEHCTAGERAEYFDLDGGKPKWKRATVPGERSRLQRLAFLRMGYDERLKHCRRPEEIDGPSLEAWGKVNAHLGTSASTLPELIRELGERRFGHVARVADAFCGGGSIPFEAARIGCEVYGSDLNPVAAVLTWGALNIVGGGSDVAESVQVAQRRVYEEVRRQIDEWGIEQNELGWRADAYLYCVEVRDPTTGWRVPLAPTWVVGQGSKTIVRLVPAPQSKSFDFEVVQNATESEMRQAQYEATWRGGIVCPVDRDGHWLPPAQRIVTGIEQVRGRDGLRMWENDDVVPRPGDALQERLYCIRWVDADGNRYYQAPTEADMHREGRVLALLHERFAEWQAKGLIPSRRIEPGDKTDEPIRTRGWTYWHHLFNPRQLLAAGLYVEESAKSEEDRGLLLLLLGRLLNWNSRLTVWITGAAQEQGGQVFYNQALNPMLNYSSRPWGPMRFAAIGTLPARPIAGSGRVEVLDARRIADEADLWMTDPGYADSVNYSELSEYFLAWYENILPEVFPDWYTDSKRALAVEGAGEDFRKAMVECYSRFTELMPDNGFQVVMFTHTNAGVWADLALIMWASGLRVSAAWTVATETEAGGLKKGNYVQGTVLLVLRKRLNERRGDMSDLYPDLQAEVQAQLHSMLALDDKEDPNFSDADYQLAAYAAALRVLTAYSSLDEIDVQRELTRVRTRGEKSPLVGLIERAVRIASDVLVPAGLDKGLWRKLGPEERFYLKGIEVESHGDYREGVYQEYARGYGVREYRPLLGSGAANQVRIKTPSEFKARDLSGEGFAGSLLRQVLFAVYKTAEAQDPRVGRDYLKMELPTYWEQRQSVLALLTYLSEKPKPDLSMAHWNDDVEAARLLRGSIEHDSA